MPTIGINNTLSEAFSCTFHLLTLKAILLWANMLPLLLLFVGRGVIGRVFSFFLFFNNSALNSFGEKSIAITDGSDTPFNQA